MTLTARPEGGLQMNNMRISNLGPGVTEQDLRSLFEKHGAVRRFKMMTDRWTGVPRGFAFVEMRNDSEAEGAITALNGREFKGKVLKITPARIQVHRKVV
jgi:cold-inducible RNA-binding protein